MPRLIIKPERDRNLYVEWSTVVDAPTYWMSRADMAVYLAETQRGPLQSEEDLIREVQALLNRVDDTGTSALWPSREKPWGGWDDSGFVVMNVAEGWLPRARLADFIDRLSNEQPVQDLLDPFEDEES